MSEKDFNAGQIPSNAPVPPPKPPHKKRSLILKIVAGAIVCLILLVLAAPTLLSSSPVVSIALGQVNKQLNGKVEIASLSLGWFTGVKLEGVKVLDGSGAQIAELDHASIPYPLWKALTGKLAFGEVQIDGLTFDARTDANGKLNFAELAKPGASEPAGTSPAAPIFEPPVTSAAEPKASKLPDLSIDLKLTNCHGTYSQAGKPVVYLSRLDGQINIPNINQPITDQLNAAVKSGDQPEGTIAINGTAAVISQNQIAIGSAEVHQTVEVTNLDLQTIKSVIAASAGVSTLDGTLGMKISLDVTAGKTANLDASIAATAPIAFGGKVLQDDIFKTNTFQVAIPRLSAVFPDGLDQWQSGRIKVGADSGASQILFKLDQGQVTVVADLIPQAILNLIAKKQPGSDGQLVVSSSFDLAGIIPQLRHSIPEAEGVLIKSAGLSENLKLVLSPDKAQLLNSADSTQVTGIQTLANGQTKPISIPEIHLSVGGEDLGGGGTLPDLHDLNLKIQSPFANGNFQGQSLSDLHGSLTANLQTLQSEISQFVDLGKINLGGDLSLDVTGSGTLSEAPYQAKLKATLALHDFKYADSQGPRVDEPLTKLVLSADMQGSAQTTVESAKNLALALIMGTPDAPTVDVLAEVPSLQLNGESSGNFSLSRFTIDLAKLQQQLAAVPAGTAGVVVNRGSLSISSTGEFAPHHVSINQLTLAGENLFVARQLTDGQQIAAISGETVHLNLAADLDSGADTSVKIKTLALSDAGQIIDVHKTADSDFVLTKNSTGAIAGSGQLALAVQLGSISQIVGILGQKEATANPAAGNLQSGRLTGTLGIAAAGPGNTGVSASLNLDGLIFTTPAGTPPYAAKPVDLKLQAAVQTGDGKSPLEQLQITQLTGNLGIATLSMSTPIAISQLPASPIATGGIQLVGNLTDLTGFLAAIKGVKPDAYPYRGDYTLNENISTQQGTISLKGGIQIAKFQSYNGDTTSFSEDLVNIANDVSLTTAGDDESVRITNFTAAMQSSGAANVSIANGSIDHLDSSRDLQLQMNVNYDLAKLWPVVQPMMGDKYKTLKIAGQFQKQFNVTGSYPANVPSTAAIKTLHADGDLAVTSFDYNGLNLQNFILPFTLDQGHLITVYSGKPAGQNTAAPAVANSGTLDLSNLDIDLTQDPPRLTTQPNKPIISQVTINPLFAQSYLAKVLNNPLFSETQKATGILDLSIADCTQLPLGDLLNQAVVENTGKADLIFSLTDLNIGVQGLSGLASALKKDSFTANIKDGTVSVAHGISTQHMSFATGKYSLDFDGKVRLTDEAFIPLKLSIGPLPAIFSSFGLRDSNLLSNLPDRVVVPVEGTVSHAHVRLDKAFGQATKEAAGKAITNGLFGGNKNGGNNNKNPLGGLLQQLDKKQN